jgi:spore maturation protein SpmB
MNVAAIMQDCTETTLYVLAVYFGSVGIKHVRHAIACALLAGITVVILAGYWFFH